MNKKWSQKAVVYIFKLLSKILPVYDVITNQIELPCFDLSEMDCFENT